jgi:raffinose/stachyose/melibiose transport system substrate-binding protein
MRRTRLYFAAVVACATGAWIIATVNGVAHAAPAKVSGKITVLAASTQSAQFNLIAKEFEAANPGVSVIMDYVPILSIGSTLQTDVSAGNPPDVVESSPGASLLNGVEPLAASGVLTNLSKSSWVKYIPAGLKAGDSYKGKVYAWPLELTPTAIIYDKGFFAKHNLKLPQTFTQLIAECKTATADGVQFMVANQLTLLTAVSDQYVAAADPNWISQRASGKVKFADSPLWTKTFQRIQQMLSAGCLGKASQTITTPTAINQLIVAGTAVTAADGTSNIPTFEAAGAFTDGGAGVFAFPGDKASQTEAQLNAIYSLSVLVKAPNPNAAVAFTSFAASRSTSIGWATFDQSISPYNFATLKLSSLLAPEAYLYKAHRVTFGVLSNFDNPEVQLALTSGLQGLEAGSMTIPQILASADTAWEGGTG